VTGVRRLPAREGTVAISAHRGGREDAPAGTIEAYRSALDLGVDLVEIDVQRTRDGHLVAHHDKLAEAGGVYPHDLLRRDLERDGPVVSAADLFTLVAGRCRAHVDIKRTGYEPEVLDLAMDLLGPDGFLVTGDDEVIRAVKKRLPDVYAAVSLGRGRHEIPPGQLAVTRRSEIRPVERVRACGADGAAMHWALARLGALGRCRRAGIGTMVWTVDRDARIRSLLRDDRLDVLITERPGFAMRVRDAGGRS